LRDPELSKLIISKLTAANDPEFHPTPFLLVVFPKRFSIKMGGAIGL
jgi:hypothetical protein